MDRLRALQAFARVAELGSFTRAAAQLQWPKARITVLVQQLEEHLAVKLLHRTTRRLTLTDDGVAYLEGVQRVLADIDELDGAVAQRRSQPRGRLRVDVPAAAGRHVIAPALPEFFWRYPEIQLELGSSDRPVDLIAEGVDCVIRGGLVHDDQLVARRLGAFEVITCAAPEYLARYGTPRSPDDLEQHRAVNFFSSKTGSTFAFDFARDGQAFERQLSHQVSANDADTHVALTLAGLGIAQSPHTRVLAEHLATGRLVPILKEWNAGRLPLYVMYPRNRHLSGRVRAFVDWVAELYRGKLDALGASPRI